jgi:hypothetical protein
VASDLTGITTTAENIGYSFKYPNFMKIRPVGTKLFHVEGQANMTEQTVVF